MCISKKRIRQKLPKCFKYNWIPIRKRKKKPKYSITFNYLTLHWVCSWTSWRGAVICIYIQTNKHFCPCAKWRNVLCGLERQYIKSTLCTRNTTALCIPYFPLHLAVILVPNEITHKNRSKCWQHKLQGQKSQSSQGSI